MALGNSESLAPHRGCLASTLLGEDMLGFVQPALLNDAGKTGGISVFSATYH